MDKYIKRPPCYEHLAPVFQTLPCDTCHRHLAGSFRASCSGFRKVKSSYQKMCGMSKKFYRGNSWQNSWQNTRREIHIENHRKIAGKIHRNLQNRRRWDNRKVHRKGGTDTGLADDSDLTFVEVYDFFHHREANAVSLCSMGAVSLVETV